MHAQWNPGQKVFALTKGFQPWNKDGTYAGYYAVKEEDLAAPPATMSFEEAGAMPLAALTAFQVKIPPPSTICCISFPLADLWSFSQHWCSAQSLEAAGVKEGQRVLIHAGAGGVGTFAIQLAKARGAHVITTAGPRNLDFVTKVGISVAHACLMQALQMSRCPGRTFCLACLVHPIGVAPACPVEERRYSHCAHSLAPVNVVARQGRKIKHVLQELGADEVIDYTAQRFEDVLKSNPVDAVIDPVGGELQERSQLGHVHPFPFHFWRGHLYSFPSLSMPASINHNLRVSLQ